MREPHIATTDTGLMLWHETEALARPVYAALQAELLRLGFTVGPCAETEKHYPTLAPGHRRGRREQLDYSLELSGRTVKFEAWQESRASNPAGGRYDFRKVDRMDYLTRLRFVWTRRHLLALLAGMGFPLASERLCMSPSGRDPLAAFNSGWGADRFTRGPDGWPDARELSSWDRRDGDGKPTSSGDTRFVQPWNARGRWVRCRVYGGINGMWHCYCNGAYLNNVNVGNLRSVWPGRGRRFSSRERVRVLEGRLEKAVHEKRFLAAHGINQELERLKAEATKPKE
ncbi:hypothetical protein [Gemmata sp.]|uniref:hypothetical protein n=1 Tax=Gemmata sp. TaxID=1914242 RepID=UPI003F6F4691